MDAYPTGEHPGPSDDTDESGRFSMFVLGGSFELHLYFDYPDGRRRIGSYGDGDGFAGMDQAAGTIHIRNRDVTGVMIRLPIDPSDPE